MKVETRIPPKPFCPVTITLETCEEVDRVVKYLRGGIELENRYNMGTVVSPSKKQITELVCCLVTAVSTQWPKEK